MANSIPKGYYECEKCKSPWLTPKFKRVVFSADKKRVIREEITYYCDLCGHKAFTIDEKADNNG